MISLRCALPLDVRPLLDCSNMFGVAERCEAKIEREVRGERGRLLDWDWDWSAQELNIYIYICMYTCLEL